MPRPSAWFLLGVLSCTPLTAQTPAPAPAAAEPAPPVVAGMVTEADLPNLRLSLKAVVENRTRPPGASTSLSILVEGAGLPVPAVVRRLTVTKALDHLERPVAPIAGRGSNPTSTVFALSNSQTETARPTDVLASAALELLPRSTPSLRTVEGTIELFTPTEANGGLILIPNIKVHGGRLEHPEFAKRGIAFVYIASPDDYAEAQRLQGQSGPGGLSTRLGANPDGKTTFGYFFHDTTGTMAGAQLQDSKGHPLVTRENGGVSSQNFAFMNFIASGGIPDDAQLAIYLAVPEAIKKVSFRFENVPLP